MFAASIAERNNADMPYPVLPDNLPRCIRHTASCMVAQGEAEFSADLALPVLDDLVVELLDPPAADADDVVRWCGPRPAR